MATCSITVHARSLDLALRRTHQGRDWNPLLVQCSPWHRPRWYSVKVVGLDRRVGIRILPHRLWLRHRPGGRRIVRRRVGLQVRPELACKARVRVVEPV